MPRHAEILHDDKLLARKLIKDNDIHLMGLFEGFKRDKSYTELQIRLRKYLQGVKQLKKRNDTLTSDKESINNEQKVYSQQSQPGSYKNSSKCSPEKIEKQKVIMLDIGVLKEKMDEVSSHRSFGKAYYLQQRNNSSKKEGGLEKNCSGGRIGTFGVLHERAMKSSSSLLNNSILDKSLQEVPRHEPVSKRSSFAEGPARDFSKITIRINSKPKS
jgi:hypothetical protein